MDAASIVHPKGSDGDDGHRVTLTSMTTRMTTRRTRSTATRHVRHSGACGNFDEIDGTARRRLKLRARLVRLAAEGAAQGAEEPQAASTRCVAGSRPATAHRTHEPSSRAASSLRTRTSRAVGGDAVVGVAVVAGRTDPGQGPAPASKRS
jgi:hypothetical protein